VDYTRYTRSIHHVVSVLNGNFSGEPGLASTRMSLRCGFYCSKG